MKEVKSAVGLEVVLYDSLDGCMKAFFHLDPSDTLPEGRWCWQDGDRVRVWPMGRVLRAHRKRGVWGFASQKREVHLWVSDHAKADDLMETIGHELGHCLRPYHRDRDTEERKADQYGKLAREAFSLMEQVRAVKP